MQASQHASDVLCAQLPIFQVTELTQQLAVKMSLSSMAEELSAMLSHLAVLAKGATSVHLSTIFVLSIVAL